MCAKKLVLGSASPRRARILDAMGVPFDVVAPEVEEVLLAADARATVTENARRKLAWVRARHPDRPIVTADTVVVFDGRCLAKPATRAEAYAFLRRFSGNRQTVLTGVGLYDARGGSRVDVEESGVLFRVLTERDIDAYFAEVNPMDKAGAYDIGQAGERIIAAHEGSWTNIMGLPRERIERWWHTWNTA